MSFSPDGITTGGAVTGLTSPTYTVSADTAPALNAKQWVVSALGGTQTNAQANSVTYPFTMTLRRPANVRSIPPANPVTGLRSNIPKNRYEFLFRKGGDCASGVPDIAISRLSFEVPAGMETYDVVELKALLSFIIGTLTEEADDIIDTIATGVI